MGREDIQGVVQTTLALTRNGPVGHQSRDEPNEEALLNGHETGGWRDGDKAHNGTDARTHSVHFAPFKSLPKHPGDHA